MVTMANEKIVRRISISTGSMLWLLFLAGPARNRRNSGFRVNRQPAAKLEPSNRENVETGSGAG